MCQAHSCSKSSPSTPPNTPSKLWADWVTSGSKGSSLGPQCEAHLKVNFQRSARPQEQLPWQCPKRRAPALAEMQMGYKGMGVLSHGVLRGMGGPGDDGFKEEKLQDSWPLSSTA